MNKPTRHPTRIPYAGVICRLHGKVDIEQADYVAQMNDVHSRWRCPICKQFAEFDDDRYEQLHPQPEE
jgi:hypothetical protein